MLCTAQREQQAYGNGGKDYGQLSSYSSPDIAIAASATSQD